MSLNIEVVSEYRWSQCSFILPTVTTFQFNQTIFEAAEGPSSSTVAVCVEIMAGVPTIPVILTLDPMPVTADGELLRGVSLVNIQ
jgi:hypothetical protein